MITQETTVDPAPAVRYSNVVRAAEQAAALAMTSGAARIVGLPLEDVAEFNRQLDGLLGGPSTSRAEQSHTVTAGVRCQGLTPPTENPSPWALPPVARRSAAESTP
jgi:hypothetical protein